jgi:hypothetical protein
MTCDPIASLFPSERSLRFRASSAPAALAAPAAPKVVRRFAWP